MAKPVSPESEHTRALLFSLARESPKAMAARTSRGFTGKEILDAAEKYARLCDEGLDPNEELDVDSYEAFRDWTGAKPPVWSAVEYVNFVCEGNALEQDLATRRWLTKKAIERVVSTEIPIPYEFEAPDPYATPQQKARVTREKKKAAKARETMTLNVKQRVRAIMYERDDGDWLFK